MYRLFFPALAAALTLLVSLGADAQTTYQNFPATARFVVVAAGLPDGTFLVYNGDEVFRQDAPGADAFTSIASGYDGDPSFLTVAPNGTFAALGAGGFTDPYTGDIYGFDVSAPANFTPAAVEVNRNHFAAAFLTDDLLLIDAGVFPDSELAIVDLSAKSGERALRTVARKPKADKTLVVDPKPGFSANVYHDAARDRVYAMDSNTRELRYFSAAALISAFNTASTLDWTTDGTQVGATGVYYSSGVVGVSPGGDLIIGGSEGFGLPGGIQLVDPDTGAIRNTVDPAGDEGFAAAAYNAASDELLVQQSGAVYSLTSSDLEPAPAGPTPGVPAMSGFGLAALAAGLGLLLVKNGRRK